MAKALTAKQKEVFTFLTEFSRQNAYQPSQDEIAERIGVRKSTVHGHLKAIEGKGYIELSRGEAKRRIKILRNPDGSPFELQTTFFRTELTDRTRTGNKPLQSGLEKIHFLRIEHAAIGLIYRYIEERCETPDIPVPIPVEGIAEMLDLKIESVPIEGEHSGQLLWREQKIFVNSLQPRQRQRFTVAHELGHFILHSTNATSFCLVRALGREEREANYFAARLLMPTEAVRDAWNEVSKRLPRQDKDGQVDHMAVGFDVSRGAILRCLRELRFMY